MSDHQLTTNITIEVDGAKIPEDAKAAMLETVVDQHVHIPDMFTTIKDDLFKGFKKYEIEKIHPHFFNNEIDSFRKSLNKIRRKRKNVHDKNPSRQINRFFR